MNSHPLGGAEANARMLHTVDRQWLVRTEIELLVANTAEQNDSTSVVANLWHEA